MSNQNTNYTAASIKILEDRDAVRKRPGMYIGSTDSRGLHHLVWEIVDNAIDERLAGYGNVIDVQINKDGSISITDHGRGIPVGKHESGKSTPEVIFTILHAGGKFSQDGAYKSAGGLHGVGASVVNFLSKKVLVNIYRDNKEYEISFKDGGILDKNLKQVGTSKSTGTKVTFYPDEEIFNNIDFNFNAIAQRLQESAFLNKGLHINLKDLREDEIKEVSYCYDKGIISFVEYLNEEKHAYGDIIDFDGENNDIEIEIAMQYSDGYSENILSFVNNVKTVDGGSHEAGFKSGLTKVFNDYARAQNILKQKDKNLEGSDIREGLCAIISIRVPEGILQFEGQTKGKLGTPIARASVENLVYDKMYFYLEEHKEFAQNLCKKALRAQQAREAARKARENVRKGKDNAKNKILGGKLTPAQSKNIELNELFIVEGDSAGGSAKQGRDRKHQAILPLRGKVINTQKAKLADILKNEEIATLINTIGGEIGNEFDAEDCNYGKVIIMTDADVDGAHIQNLLLTFFYIYMKDLFLKGKIYLACPPLYKYHKKQGKKDILLYAYDEEELKKVMKEYGKGEIQRYKGLGEMNASQLWETTMDPKERKLIQVGIEDMAAAEKRINVLMGDKPESRKKWIDDNVVFTLEDDYTKILEGVNNDVI
ncbi:MAG: DNA topoisomerase IV subunit B [Bacilli bacterium]|jgi:topoisomerase-4 subunit B|nr:DNA topoisomerase IV subunit B [Bacilli bacterium]